MGHFLQILEEREEQPQKVLEKDPVGSKVLERNVCVSSSEIKAEKEQPDHGNFRRYVAHWLIGITIHDSTICCSTSKKLDNFMEQPSSHFPFRY